MKKKDRSKEKARIHADAKGFKQLIKRADIAEFERLARMELDNANKLVKVSMRNMLNGLSRVDPEGYEIYQREGMPGLMKHFVAIGTMTKREYNAWKRERKEPLQDFKKAMKLYLEQLEQNPGFREQEMKKFK